MGENHHVSGRQSTSMISCTMMVQPLGGANYYVITTVDGISEEECSLEEISFVCFILLR